MTKRIFAAVWIGLATMAVGCGGGAEIFPERSDTSGFDQYFTNQNVNALRATDASLQGSMGEISMQGKSTRLDTFSGNGWSEVATTLTDPRSSMMTILVIWGGVQHPDLQDGDQLVFSGKEAAVIDGLHIEMIGCSGAKQDDWSVDKDAQSVEIRVEDQLGSPTAENRATVRTIHYRGNFAGPQTIVGKFSYPLAAD